HPLPELGPAGPHQQIALTVRQQVFPYAGPGSRESQLCYSFTAADGRVMARAPVIRVKPGQHLSIRLENRITDSAAIESFVEGPVMRGAAPFVGGPAAARAEPPAPRDASERI